MICRLYQNFPNLRTLDTSNDDETKIKVIISRFNIISVCYSIISRSPSTPHEEFSALKNADGISRRNRLVSSGENMLISFILVDSLPRHQTHKSYFLGTMVAPSHSLNWQLDKLSFHFLRKVCINGSTCC